MLSNYLKTGIRTMKKSPLFTFISIFGLAVSLAAFTMIFLYIYGELTTDRCHKNYDNIYKVETKDWHEIAYPVKSVIEEEMPGIEAIALLMSFSTSINYNDEKFFIEKPIFTDPEFLDIFTIKVISGNGKSALEEPNKILLSKSQAKRIFGEENPVDKIVTINRKYEYTVSGVFEDLPQNVHIQIPMLSSISNLPVLRNRVDILESWQMWSFRGYIRVNENADIQDITNTFNQRINVPGDEEDNWGMEFYLRSLKNLYFYNGSKTDHLYSYGNKQYVNMFMLAGILIIIIAIINYINLTTARVGVRATEIGIRKTLGASSKNITVQFLMESFINILIAVTVSLILVFLLLPHFNNLIHRELTFEIWNNPLIILVFFSGTILISLLAGIYPAIFLSNKKTTQILKHQTVHGKKGIRFRKILISFQLIITISLTLATLIIFKQMRYMTKSDMGLNKENILYYRMPWQMMDNKDSLKEELLKSSTISKVAFSMNILSDMSSQLGIGLEDGTIITTIQISGDIDYADIFGMKFVVGENFSAELPKNRRSMIVNETFIKRANIKDPLNAVFHDDRKIVGVVEDFCFQTLHNNIEPLALIYPLEFCKYVNIKINTNSLDNAIDHIQEVSDQFAGEKIEIKFLDDTIAQAYWREKQFGTLFTIFSIIAIVVSSLGILGMILFESERRTKEIGIRKTMGATTIDILLIFAKQLLVLFAAACLVSWCVTYLLMDRWLQDFAFKTEMSWWLFAVSGGIVFLVSAITYSSHAIKTARTNPVDTLKYE
jgi:putative ABC transport system permease protein